MKYFISNLAEAKKLLIGSMNWRYQVRLSSRILETLGGLTYHLELRGVGSYRYSKKYSPEDSKITIFWL